MAYRGNGGGGRRVAGGSGGDGGRPSPPPSTPRPVLMGGYHGLMVLQHQGGAYGVLMASDQPSGQVAVFRAPAPAPPQYFISPARPESPITAPPPTTSPASPTSTPAPPRQPALQSAFSTPSSEPAPAASSTPSPVALAKEVKKNLFVSETALARPAAAAQGTAAAGAAVDASDLVHTARPGLAIVGKDVMIRGNVSEEERKALRIRRVTVQASPALAAHLQTSPKPQVSKYSFKAKASSQTTNDKDDVKHDSTRIQPRSPLSRQSLTFNATPTYHAGAFYEIDYDKLHPKSPSYLNSIRVLKVSECTNLDFLSSRDARFGAPVMRQVLREEARKHVGDTSLLDQILKHMAGLVAEGSVHRFRDRQHNADGAMDYCLEPAELAEVRRQAGVSDPYWVPRPGWKLIDDLLRQVEELTKEVNNVKRQMEQLTCKDDGDFDAESAYNSLNEKYQRAVRANEKLEKQVIGLKDTCENVVKMNGELKKEVSSFMEKNQYAARANEKLEKQVICVKDTCENVVKMNGELKKVSSFMEHILDMNDKLEEQITYLSNSFLSFKDQLVLALEMETERQLELAPSEAVPRPVLYVGSGEQMIPRTDGTVIKGGQDRPLRKSSFHVSKPQGTFLWPSMASRGFRLFSTSNKPDESDLKPLFDSNRTSTIHWPLNGPDICEKFDDLIGHLRLYDAVHGQALDVSDMLGDEKIVYTTAVEGTQYVKVSYTENGKDYWFKLIVDAREGWNYGWQNKYGIFEYKDSASNNPYIVGSMHLDFQSDYGSIRGVCSMGHGNVLMGPAAVRASCKLIAEYDGRTPAPHQLRMACALFLNYILESMKFHHVYHLNRLSLLSGALCTLKECEPALPLLVKKWSKLGGPLITFLAHQLKFPPERLWRVKGIEHLDPLHKTVAIVPYNRLQPVGTNTRTWRYFAEDDSNNGQAHWLSRDFLKTWPFNRDVALLRSSKRKVNVSAAWRLPPGNLAKDSIANNIKIIERVASRHNRFGFKPSRHARSILFWTLKAIR